MLAQNNSRRYKNQAPSAESSPNQIILKGSTLKPLPRLKHSSRSPALTYSQLALDAAAVVGPSELRAEDLQPHELGEVVAGLEDPTDSLALLAAEYQV